MSWSADGVPFSSLNSKKNEIASKQNGGDKPAYNGNKSEEAASQESVADEFAGINGQNEGVGRNAGSALGVSLMGSNGFIESEAERLAHSPSSKQQWGHFFERLSYNRPKDWNEVTFVVC